MSTTPWTYPSAGGGWEPTPYCGQTRHLWKQYLTATLFAGGNQPFCLPQVTTGHLTILMHCNWSQFNCAYNEACLLFSMTTWLSARTSVQDYAHGRWDSTHFMRGDEPPIWLFTLWRIEAKMSDCLLVSTYVVCERLSVMHQPARLPEFFDQILQNTPVLEFGSRTPPPKKLKLFPEFKCELTQNTPPMKNSNFLSFLSSNLSLPRTTPPKEKR